MCCVHTSMDLWHLSYACTWWCVSAARNEGHPNDLDSCEWRKPTNMFFCVYVWRITSIAWPVFSLSFERTNTGHACAPSSTPCLPVNGHPSDCQGISQVAVQLTLTYSLVVVWGSISCPLVSIKVETQELVWNVVIACMAVSCFPSFLTPERSQDAQLPWFFFSWLCPPPYILFEQEWLCGWNGNRSFRGTQRISVSLPLIIQLQKFMSC